MANISMSASKVTLFCILENSKESFPVTVMKRGTVHNLKKAIKEEVSPELDKVPTRNLTLWKLKTPLPSKEASKLTRADMEGEEWLDPAETVAKYWTDTVPARVVHIFITDPLQANPAIGRISLGNNHLNVPEEVLDANEIRVSLLPDGNEEITADVIATLPENAQWFCNTLSGLVAVPKSPTSRPKNVTDHLVACLKEALGKQFTNHFKEVDEDDTSAENIETLLPFLSANYCHDEKRENFTSDRKAMYKETCLTGVLVDSVLHRLEGAFVRDEYIDMVLERGGKFYSWQPRNDFQLRYGYAGVYYGLLHGETESALQTERDAMCKMAIMSLYSHKIIKYATEKEQVILSSYVSEEWCTMYLFFPDLRSQGYNMQQIVRYRHPWCRRENSPYAPLGFVRRIHNFSKLAKPISGETQAIGKKFSTIKRGVRTLPSLNSSHPTQDKSRKRKSRPGADDGDTAGGNQPAPTDVARLVAAYPGMRHNVRERLFIQKIPRKPAICAKWTPWTEEVEMLQSLKSSPHIIPIIDIIKCSDESIFIVMPHYTPLNVAYYHRDLIGIGEYKDLRHQLIEGVAFLHSRDVAHCDIKPDNLVVQNPEPPLGTLYIIDLGNAVSCASTKLQCGFRGTEGWTAPEVQDGNWWDPRKADIWALGTVLTYFAQV
ncbi:Chromosomal serine/threonine-protein kinase jil-1 [Tulasnella sp. 403]|nr:Chromosomal serine/threonine-protein kinase jil-1 [Tulasnella sp. 403]